MTTVARPRTAEHKRARAKARPGWWDEPFRVFQTNLREIDAAMDVEATLDDIQAHGADVWLLNVGGILSHYPTELPFQTRNPYLRERPGGDLVADALAATRGRGMRLLARMDFSKVMPHIVEEHPDWAYRTAAGGLQAFEGLVSVCPRGEYYQARLFDVLDEVLARYDVDGFFFNWFGFNEVDYAGVVHGVCHCGACRAAWAEAEPGRDLPTGPRDEGYARWKRLAAETIDDLTSRVAAHLAARRPGAALILGRSADVLFHEANNAVGRRLWPFATADAVSALRVLQPEKPVLVNAVAFVDMPYRLAPEQPEMMRQYLLQAVSRGANPSTYIMGPTRGIAYDCLPAAAGVTRLHRDHAEVYAGLRSIADVGVVVPDPLGQDPARAGESRAEYEGVSAALREAHIPFDVVGAAQLTSVPRDRFAVLVLPDLELPEAADAWLAGYARAGGRIVATGASGLRPAGPASWHPAERLEAVVAGADALKSSYVQLAGGPEVEGSALLPRHGTAYDVRWRPDARPSAPVIAPAAYGPPEKAYGHVPGIRHAHAVRSVGTGRVAAVAWTPGRTYAELGLTAVRDALVAQVRAQIESPRVEVDAPDGLEVVWGRSAAGLVLHLLNGGGQRRNSFGPAQPVCGATVTLRGLAGATARAVLAPEGAGVRDRGDDLVVTVARVDDVEVLVVTEERFGADID